MSDLNQDNRIELPKEVSYIIDTLMAQGYEAYAVGGCVRDSLLGRVPHDWDITTNALPSQVKALFRRTIDTGIEHGTVTVMIKSEGYEVTTYRVDGDYSDGRHPDSVAFSSSLSEDLMRRDFTINAMAYNPKEGLVDLYDGIGDLKSGRIRCVGKATERFTEDALRLLRAVRFSAQLGFVIEEETATAIRALAPTIEKVSRERIHTELGKIFGSCHPEYMRLVYELGLLGAILPEYTSDEKALKEIPTVFTLLEYTADLPLCEREPGFCYACFLYPLGEKITTKLLRGLKLDNTTIEHATKYVAGFHSCLPQTELSLLRKQASRVGADYYPSVERLAYLQALATGDEMLANQWKKEQQAFAGVLERKEPLSLQELAVTGKDLIAAGVQPGKKMGELLQQLLQEVLTDPTQNDKEQLMKHMK